MTSASDLPLEATQIVDIFRRLCERLGIAFSANQVYPILADTLRQGQEIGGIEQLNAIGTRFGVRFRAMSGSRRDLLETVADSGPALVMNVGNSDSDPVLILKAGQKRKYTIHHSGNDEQVTPGQLWRDLPKDEDNRYHWFLAQPMLAAEDASRFHYQAGVSQDKPLTPLRRLLSLVRPEADDMRTILIFSIIIGLLSLTTPLAVEAVVNTIAFGRYLQPLVILSLIVLIFLGFRAALNVLVTIVAEILQRKLFVRAVEDLSYRLTRVSLSVWKKYHGPELVNRFFDIAQVQKIVSKLLLDTLMLVLQTVIGLSVLAFYHPFLLGYDIGLLAMMSFILWVIGRGAVRTAIQESQLKYETAAWLQEIVRHPSTFKFNGGLGFAINRADDLAANYVNHRQQHFRILIRQITFANAMQAIAATILLALGGYLVIEQQMTLGQLVAAELIVTVILGSFAKLGKDLESFYDLLASVDKLGKLLDLPIEPRDKLQLAPRVDPFALEIVDLKMGGGMSSPASIQFSPGVSCAISGGTELDRSRLIEILAGQQVADSGHVLLDDHRVDMIGGESLQKQVSLIREVEIFEGTVDENIRMGREQIGSDETLELIEKLGMDEIIAQLENGFATTLRISAYPLSSGQAVRLILARALIARPGVLFIDGLLDRLSDDDTVDVLQKLNEFKQSTTMVVSTGRRVIADWAYQKLDIGQSTWALETTGE